MLDSAWFRRETGCACKRPAPPTRAPLPYHQSPRPPPPPPLSFNEDGEFDDVLKQPSASPDANLAAQQDRLPPAVFSLRHLEKGPPVYSHHRLVINAQQLRANTMLRLFKMTVFRISELTKGDGGNVEDLMRVEALMFLKPFIGPLIRSIIRNALAARVPVNHIYMLRTLFRHVANDISSTLSGAPKSVHSRVHVNTLLLQIYAEFAPHIGLVVDSLVRIHAFTTDASLRDSIIECGMTIPLRLNMQLPHLAKLLHPVVLGLRSRDERRVLVSMAVRTLEFWVDNVNPSFWLHTFTLNKQLHADLFNALTALLKNISLSAHGTDALRILGKFGGLNRLHIGAPTTLPHVKHADATLPVKMTWNQPRAAYVPPDAVGEHDLAAMNAVTSGDISTPNDEIMSDERTQPPTPRDVSKEGDVIKSAAARAIKLLGAGAAAGAAAGAGAGATAGTGAAENPDVPGPQTFDVPLDRVIHHSHRLLMRYFSPARDHTQEIDSPSDPSDPGVKPFRIVRRRVHCNNAARVGPVDEFQRPIARHRRMSDSGEPSGVTPTLHYRLLPPVMSSLKRPLYSYDNVVCSDSDSSAEESTETRGEIHMSHTQGMLAATRGPLVAKRQAWALLHAILPLMLEALPHLADPTAAATCAAHLYDERGAVVTAPAAGAPIRPFEPCGAAASGAATGTDGALPVRLAAAQVTALRRAQVEYLRAIAIAATDQQLRPFAFPVLTALVRAYTVAAVRLTPLPTAESLPASLRPTPSGAAAADAQATWAASVVPTLSASTSAASIAEHLDSLPAEGVAAGGDAARVGAAASALPGSKDPLVLNIFLVSLAVDDPPSALQHSAHSIFRPLLLTLFDTIFGTLCAVARPRRAGSGIEMDVDMGGATSTGATSAPSANGTAEGGSSFTAGAMNAEIAADAALRSASSSADARLHAATVTGRLLLGDLVARVSHAALTPTLLARQGSMGFLLAILTRCPGAIAQYYALDIARAALHVLRSYAPEQAALTVAGALHVIHALVRPLLPPLAQERTEITRVQELGLTPEDTARWTDLTRATLESLISPVAACREAAAYVLGTFVRHVLAGGGANLPPPRWDDPPAAAPGAAGAPAGSNGGLCLGTSMPSEKAISRGMLALMSTYAKDLLKRLFARRDSVRSSRPAEQVGLVLAGASLLNLVVAAKMGEVDSSELAGGGADAATSVPWLHAARVISVHHVYDIMVRLRQTLIQTKLHDPGAIFLSPAYVAAVAGMAATRLPEFVVGTSSQMYGIATGPLTTAAAAAHTNSPYTLHMVNVPSSSNPPPTVPSSVADVHAVLSAAQAYPFPMAVPGRTVASMAGEDGDITAAWLDPADDLCSQ